MEKRGRGRPIDWAGRINKAEALLPNSAVDTDNYGQLIIYTGLIVDGDTTRPMTEADFDEDWDADQEYE